MNHESFMTKAARDARARELTARGFRVRKSSIRNQQTHPMYVADYESVTGIRLTQADCGFGNTIYKTHFPVLYSVDYEHETGAV